MDLRSTTITTFTFLLIMTSAVLAQADSNCLWLQYPDEPGVISNPNSIKIDTCTGSPTYGHKYAKGAFQIKFRDYAIRLPKLPSDSTVIITWQTIDTSFVEMRKEFSDLEAVYGPFVLEKQSPAFADSTDYRSFIYWVKFERDVCTDLMVSALEGVNGIKEVFFDDRIIRRDNSVPTEHNSASQKSRLSVAIDRSLASLEIAHTELCPGCLLEIFDMAGYCLLKKSTTESNTLRVDISGLPNGAYIIRYNNRSIPIIVGR